MSVMMRNGVQYAGVPDERLETLEEIVGDGQQSVGSDLTDAVTQLNSSLSTKELTASDLVTNGVFNVGICQATLSGNTLNITMTIRAAGVATTSTSVLATIKSGYRPKQLQFIKITDNNNKNQYLKFDTDGKITADVAYTTSNSGLLILSACYII